MHLLYANADSHFLNISFYTNGSTKGIEPLYKLLNPKGIDSAFTRCCKGKRKEAKFILWINEIMF